MGRYCELVNVDAADNEDDERRLFNSLCKRSRCSLPVCEIKLQFLKNFCLL